ncbi:MAG: endolytic transglycosylase MltG [Gallionellaceae bacterium]|nr:endolytic transglycosylase MltG [Gallionellaceae bacterium]
MLRRLIAILSLFVLAGLGWLGWYASTPVTQAQLPAEFSIASGTHLRGAAQQFEAMGLISHPTAFVLLGRLLGQAGKVKAGSYMVGKPLSPYQLLNKVTLGETLLAKVTVIEGWSFAQMRAAIDADPHLRHDSAGMSDADLLKAIGAIEAYPEGLFFPDTYFFDAGASDLDLYRRAYHTLAGKLATAWQGRLAGLPYASPYQALIMASIVEKETGAPDERPLIASVFLNRLRIGMRLQTDPTVIYGLGERYDGNLRKVDLLTDTPYNSYTRAGLPPTPIALPSEAAIDAVLHPDSSRALYFVAKGGGRHQFSNTLDEHNRAVDRYQRGGRG